MNDDGKGNRAEGADGRMVSVNSDHCKGVGGEGNDGNNDGSLHHQLRFYFEGKFHARS